jgi:hypothetical protein
MGVATEVGTGAGGVSGGATIRDGPAVGGDSTSAADGFVGEPDVPMSLARAPALSVLTSSVPVMVSLDFLLVNRIVDSLLVDIVEVAEGRLSFVDVAIKPPPSEPAVSRLPSLGGTGGACGVSGPSSST